MSLKKTSHFSLVLVLVLIAGTLMFPASAFETRSADNIVIEEPIDDDLIASGGSMIINAPVKSITWVGGTLIVNEPVETNIIAAGGTIQVNAPVGTDIIAAGGNIDLNGNVGGKILAAGGSVTMSGIAENIAASGGTVVLGKNAVISKDAIISASGYTTQALIQGNLTIEEGTDTEPVDFHQIGDLIGTFVTMLLVIFAIGYLILGILLFKLCPDFAETLTKTGRDRPLLSLVCGIAGIVIAGILFIVLVITLIGIPLALFMIFLVLAGMLISTIISGAVLGTWVLELAKRETALIWAFIGGFILLNILFCIPFLGALIWIVAFFLGFGALILTFYEAYAGTHS